MSDHEKDDEPLNSIPDRDIIINSRELVRDDVVVRDVHEALSEASVISSGYENVSRTFRECRNGELTEERINNALDDRIQSILEPVLFQYGLLPDQESVELVDGEATEGGTQALEASSKTIHGEVPASDVKAVRDKIEILHEESEALLEVDDSVGARRAEFLGNTVISMLDELLEE